MRTVDISVRHDNDAVVAELVGIKLVFSDAAAKRRYQRTHFGRAQHFVKTRLLHIEYLAFKRKNRLKLSITPLLRRPPCGVALDDEQFGLGGIAFLAVGEFAGQRGDVHHALAPGQFARALRRLARGGGVNNLADDPAYGNVLKQMRKSLSRWENRSGDQGVNPEPKKMFDSDMKLYVDTMEARKRPIEHINTIKSNIELMRKWAREGK